MIGNLIMAKQVVAATKIVHDGETIEVGSVLEASKFSKEQLTRLYERGAVRVENAEAPEPEPKLSDVTDNTKAEVRDGNTPNPATPTAKPVPVTPIKTDTDTTK